MEWGRSLVPSKKSTGGDKEIAQILEKFPRKGIASPPPLEELELAHMVGKREEKSNVEKLRTTAI